MKRITSIAALTLISTLAFTSCKKDYTCTCTTTEAGTNVKTVYEKQMRHQSKINAEETCRTFEVQLNNDKRGVTECIL